MEIKNLSISYDKKVVIDDVSCNIIQNKLTMILGVNGSGKSTFVKAIKRLIPYKGNVIIDKQDSADLTLKDMSRKIAYMSQKNVFEGNLTVEEYLEFARHPYSNFLSLISKEDKKIIYDWANKLDLTKILDSDMSKISGGQMQRVLLASTLIQDTSYIILDEPNNNLDVKYKLELLKILKNIENKTIIFVTHDINDAIHFADQILILHEKKMLFADKPAKITAKLLGQVFDVKVKKSYQFTFSHKD